MAKKAPKKSQKSTSASASSSQPAKMAPRKVVIKLTSTEKMKKEATNRSRPNSPQKPRTRMKNKALKIEDSKPKKPPTAFFFFLEDFRKGFQEQNPGVKSMRDVGKACGEKWKTMTYEEKVKYYDIATEKRAMFDRAMADYIKRKESGDDQEAEESESDEDY